MNTNSRGGPGKGSSRSNTRNSTESTTYNKEKKMEFTPHTAGRHQTVTYDTVKEYILQEIQKELQNGSNLSVNLRKGTDVGIPIMAPIRHIFKKVKKEDGSMPEDIEIKIDQEGHDMEYTIDLKEFKTRQNTYDENKFKAYTRIFGYCNKIMQNRIEETTDFELNIRNDPFLLMETIKMKMYGQVRAKYEFVQPTYTILQFLSLHRTMENL